MLWERIIFL